MKVKVISRNAGDFVRQRGQDIFRLPRNIDPVLHPFERAREYTRAVNATKLERVFAKPFVGALEGHSDGVYSFARHPSHLSALISGSADGELRVWNLINQKCVWKHSAHRGFIRGVTVTPDADGILSAGDDRTVRLWKLDYDNKNWGDVAVDEPEASFLSKHAFSAIDHHRHQGTFATAGNVVNIWDINRTEPTMSFEWGTETLHSVRYNQTETNILASCGSDRTIVLYDVRAGKPLTKLTMEMRSNTLAWNPMEAFVFTAANEDHNCYTFDMRKMDSALNVLRDHVSAVMDVDYSPTGQEIVTGSYDCSIRLFRVGEGHSRDIYHARRMQRIFAVRFSMDSKYVLAGSDDTNIRIWKAHAAEKMGPIATRERAALEYGETLKKRFQHMPEVRRISRHRHVPRAIYKAGHIKRDMETAIKTKEDNQRRHSKPGTVPYQAERRKHIVAQEQ